ncbi:MAG: hypothetical protein IJD79_04390 [Clostridia bacterium]|nr:hypothetical protein [Clostridia bacterium]
MKRKIALLLVLVLSLSVVLTACDKKCKSHVDADLNEACDNCGEYVEYTPTYMGFEGIFNGTFEAEDEDDDKVVYGKADHVSELNDMDVSGMSGNLIVFKNDNAEAGKDKAIVLNTETGDIVLTLKEEDDDATVTKSLTLYPNDYYSSSNVYFIRVTETDTTDKNSTVYKQTLYTALGEEITSKTSKASAYVDVNFVTYTEEGYLYEIEGKIYEIVDDVATYKFDKGFKTIPTNLYYHTDKNYYHSNSSGDEVFVYDLQYNLVAYYSLPAGCESYSDLCILGDGNVLIQYVKELPWDAAEYDLYEDETKYSLTTVIFNIADGTTKEIEFNYIVGYIVNAAISPETFEDYIVSDKIENIAFAYPIVDKTLDENNEKIINLRNDMFILGYLGNEIANQEGVPELLGNNRFVVSNKAGQSFLINEKGEVIGEVTAADYDEDLELIEMDGKYYDLDLKLVKDMNEIEYDYYGSGSDYEIYRDINVEGEGEDEKTVTTYYILNGITMTKLDLPEDVYNININSYYFSYNYTVEATSEDEDDKHYTVYCNSNGEKIHTIETSEEGYAYHNINTLGDIFIIVLETYDEEYNYSTKYYIAK